MREATGQCFIRRVAKTASEALVATARPPGRGQSREESGKSPGRVREQSRGSVPTGVPEEGGDPRSSEEQYANISAARRLERAKLPIFH